MRTPFFSCLLFITSRFTQKILIYLLLTVLFQISSFSGVSSLCLDDQRSLLLQLKNTLIYNSSYSTKLVQWNQDTDCCYWKGVDCDNFGHVIVLDLYNESIYGPISSTIRNLSMFNKLTRIDLRNNDLNGSLSSTHFEGLSNLQILDLSKNSITGNIPTSLFSLPSLQWLMLNDNKFSGQVNEFPTLNSSLKELLLQGNQLEGLIPKSFFRLENLTHLELSFNFFNGTIQFEDFQTLQNLWSLDLSYNHLSVNISTVTTQLFPQLNYLYLASCNLSRFPNLRNNTNLISLDLSNNKISGDIPSWIWEVGNGSLSYLNLSHNCLKNLQTPYQIPSSIYILDLHSNMLRGEFPGFQLLPAYLDYSSNNFQGHISADIGNLTSSPPQFFSVANNRLTGVIPISLCNAVNIEVLDFSGNLLSGGLPPCLVKNLTRLGVLNIGRNNISGNIPDTFSVNCSLSTLDLSMNNLRGNIPPSLAKCKSLQVLNVASNNLHGTFPCILMNLSSLHVLLLRSNKFFGDIRCPGLGHNLSNLQIIDIAFNSFTGFLHPGFISSWSTMKLKSIGERSPPLSYSQNGDRVYYQDKVSVTMKGLVLEIVKILPIFTSIDLSSNKFQGTIPETFGELSSLYALNLSHSSFTSTIPKSLGNLTNLESLDLSANQLTGKIPTELVSLIFLSFFDVSYNELVGRIPSGRQFETFTTASYEGNLGLCGSPVNQSCDSNIPTETSTTSTGEKDVDWMFMLVGLGYAVGVALVVVPPLFSR